MLVLGYCDKGKLLLSDTPLGSQRSQTLSLPTKTKLHVPYERRTKTIFLFLYKSSTLFYAYISFFVSNLLLAVADDETYASILSL